MLKRSVDRSVDRSVNRSVNSNSKEVLSCRSLNVLAPNKP